MGIRIWLKGSLVVPLKQSYGAIILPYTGSSSSSGAILFRHSRASSRSDQNVNNCWWKNCKEKGEDESKILRRQSKSREEIKKSQKGEENIKQFNSSWLSADELIAFDR